MLYVVCRSLFRMRYESKNHERRLVPAKSRWQNAWTARIGAANSKYRAANQLNNPSASGCLLRGHRELTHVCFANNVIRLPFAPIVVPVIREANGIEQRGKIRMFPEY